MKKDKKEKRPSMILDGKESGTWRKRKVMNQRKCITNEAIFLTAAIVDNSCIQHNTSVKLTIFFFV